MAIERGANGSLKLIRCEVHNPEGKRSVRYVDLEHFQLWEYMMRHKHALTIDAVALCLWITRDEYRAKEDLYLRAGEVEPVNELVVRLFDAANGYYHTITRYVGEADSDHVKDILVSHIPDEVVNSDRFELTVNPGRCVSKQQTSSLDQLVLGLSGA